MIIESTNDGWGIRCQNHEMTVSFKSTEDMNKAASILERSGIDFDIKKISDYDYTKYTVRE